MNNFVKKQPIWQGERFKPTKDMMKKYSVSKWYHQDGEIDYIDYHINSTAGINVLQDGKITEGDWILSAERADGVLVIQVVPNDEIDKRFWHANEDFKVLKSSEDK